MSIKVRNITIGEKPLICAPVISEDEKGIIDDCRVIKKAPVDIIEWRADYFRECRNHIRIKEVFGNIREVCGDIPVIFTYRMRDEGGESCSEPVSIEEYTALIKCAADTGCADLMDIQVMSVENSKCEKAADIISAVHAKGVKVIASNHHFDMTPDDDEMKRLFKIMHDTGADILKLAVMPQNNTDVIRLMAVTDYVSGIYPEPVITMSMGKTGIISRMSGSLTGSAVTFASVKGESAPGQISAYKLAEILGIVG